PQARSVFQSFQASSILSVFRNPTSTPRFVVLRQSHLAISTDVRIFNGTDVMDSYLFNKTVCPKNADVGNATDSGRLLVNLDDLPNHVLVPLGNKIPKLPGDLHDL